MHVLHLPCKTWTKLHHACRPHLAQCVAEQPAPSRDVYDGAVVIGRMVPLVFHRRRQGLQLQPRVQFNGSVHAAALAKHADDGLLDADAHRANSVGMGRFNVANEVAEGQIWARARQDALPRQQHLSVMLHLAPRIQAAIEVEANRTQGASRPIAACRKPGGHTVRVSPSNDRLYHRGKRRDTRF